MIQTLHNESIGTMISRRPQDEWTAWMDTWDDIRDLPTTSRIRAIVDRAMERFIDLLCSLGGV